MTGLFGKVASTCASGLIGGSLSIAVMNFFVDIPYGDLRWLWVGSGGLAIGIIIQYIAHFVSQMDIFRSAGRSAPALSGSSEQTEIAKNEEIRQTEPPEELEPQVCFSTPQQLIDEHEKVSDLSASVRRAATDVHIGNIMRLSLTVKTVSLQQSMDGTERIFVSAKDHPIACHFRDVGTIEQLKAVAANDILEIEGTIYGIDVFNVGLRSCRLLAPPKRPTDDRQDESSGSNTR